MQANASSGLKRVKCDKRQHIRHSESSLLHAIVIVKKE